MKQTIIKTILFASAAVLPAFAAEGLHVSVPFSFMIGNAKMAPGQYTVTQAGNGVVTFSSPKTSAMVLTVPAEYNRGDNSSLSFTSTDNSSVLTGIQVGGAVTREIPAHNGSDRKTVLSIIR